MTDLGKHRVYECTCGARPCRPLPPDHDFQDGPYPKACDHCLGELGGRPFRIVDRVVHLRDIGVIP